MGFKNAASRGKYFEMLKEKGLLGKPSIGAPPMQKNNEIAMSPALPNVMPPKSNQPDMKFTGLAPNPMKPMNPSGFNKFSKLKKFF